MAKKPVSTLLIAFAFFNIYIIWGSTYLAVIYGLKSFPPFILVGLRYTAAGAILFAWCKFKGESLPEWKNIWRHAISGILMLVGGTGLVAWAEQYIGSGQAAILIATEPLLFLLVDRKRWPEYFSNKYIISGLLIGFTGIYFFLRLGVAESSTSNMATIASIVVILGSLIWVLGSLITKNNKGESSTVMNASIQLFAAGVGCGAVVLCKGEYHGFEFGKVTGEAWGGLIFLTIMGSLAAYLSFIWLISIKPPAIVSTHTYINPVVAVFLGWLMADEHVNTAQLICLFVILAGILLVNVPGYLKRKEG